MEQKKYRVIAMIPARFAASRFPGKLMEDLHGKPVITRTYEAARDTSLFDAVYVVTDDERIAQTITAAGGEVIRSHKEHESGSDRIAEAIQGIDADIVINVQGDEPLMDTDSLRKLIRVFEADTSESIDLASLMTPLLETRAVENPNHVKVVTDNKGRALFFSRSVIPYPRDQTRPTHWFKHVGVYAFRRQALLAFSELSMGPLEASEKIEALRYLEHGKTIQMVLTEHVNVGIDTPEDLERAREMLAQQGG